MSSKLLVPSTFPFFFNRKINFVLIEEFMDKRIFIIIPSSCLLDVNNDANRDDKLHLLTGTDTRDIDADR